MGILLNGYIVAHNNSTMANLALLHHYNVRESFNIYDLTIQQTTIQQTTIKQCNNATI